MGTQLDLPYVSGSDYSHGSLATGVRIGVHIYPLGVQPEYFPSEGILHETGRLVLLLAHPEYGNIRFYVRFTNNQWHLDPPDYTDAPSLDQAANALCYSFNLSEEVLEGIISAFEIPVSLDYQASLDYTTRSFVSALPLETGLFPAIFQTEFFCGEGILHPTPRMIVLLAHPEYGNVLFYLRSVVGDDELDHRWLLDTPEFKDEPLENPDTIAAAYPFRLSPAIIELCEQAIETAHI